MRVLIADGDPQFANAARAALRSEALFVEIAAAAEIALARAGEAPYSAIILDLALPGADGLAFLARLRRGGVSAPILTLTSIASPDAVIEALRFGADDCLMKPVLMAEFVARVHALVRRAGRMSGDCLEVEDLVLHCARRRAFRAGRAIALTGREFAALELLVRAHGQPVSAAELLAAIWTGKASPPQENFIAVLMMRIRKKVDGDHPQKLMHTLRGRGYAITVAEA